MTRAWAIIIAFSLSTAGCLHDQLVPCGDNVCPVGDLCTPAGCANAESVAACNGRADGEACTAPGIMMGACLTGVCVQYECGNGRTEEFAGETCDDGNTVSGDGCSALCVLEACGDGVPGVGELCDDGNTLGGDGCSATCRPEEPGWKPLGTRAGWYERTGMVAAFIPQRGTIVELGGRDSAGELAIGTYELVGTEWKRVPTAHTPSARENTASAYDPIRQRWVVFGGRQSGLPLADTWEFDGTDWILRAPQSSPPPTQDHSMAWDPIRQRIVLQCNCSTNLTTPNTWAYDGTTWTPINSQQQPSPRSMAAMAFDPIGQRMLLFGGGPSYGTGTNDVWQLVGNEWTPVTMSTPSPSPTTFPRMAWDPIQQAMIVDGGSFNEAKTWQLAGSTWTELSAASGFRPNNEAVENILVFDPTRGMLVRFGGSRDAAVDDLLELHADGWHWIGGEHPYGRTGGAMAVDTLRDRAVMFGGRGWNGDVNDTWTFDGTAWSRVTSAQNPPPRIDRPGMAYDSLRDRMVLVTGDGTTWELASDQWSLVTTATPAPSGPLAYDTERGVIVGVGADTREYDGVDWRVVPMASPPVSYNALMVYDAARKRIVMMSSGYDVSNPGRVWEYDGTGWISPPTLASAPPPRWDAIVVYDPRRGRVVMLGGDGDFGPMNDTWEYDGTSWHALLTNDAYGARYDSIAAALPGPDGCIVQFGGTDYQNTLDDTWLLRWQ